MSFLQDMEIKMSQLQFSLNSAKLYTRPNASAGWWMALLLPTSVLLSACKLQPVSELYLTTAVLCIGLLGSVFVFLHETFKYNLGTFCPHNWFLAALTSLLLICFTNLSWFSACVAGFYSSFFYNYGLLGLLKACPYSLTFGEASVIVQGLILFSFTSLMNLANAYSFPPIFCMDTSTVILQTGLVGIGLICSNCHNYSILRPTLSFYTLTFGLLVGFVIPMLHIIQHQSPIMWIIYFVFDNWARMLMVCYWALCSLGAALTVGMQIETQQQASTKVRKCFHILAVAVFIPGLIHECCLLYLASGVVLALFIMLEAMRVLKLPPLGSMLADGFLAFADEKDLVVSLTPLYLLVGCSLPLWIHPVSCVETCCAHENLLPLLSGLLTVGVGDTAASIVGATFGKHQWPNSKKTIEGTMACMMSQLTVIKLLILLGYVTCTNFEFLQTAFAVVVTSLVEAKTDQVDNLALPLIMYILVI